MPGEEMKKARRGVFASYSPVAMAGRLSWPQSTTGYNCGRRGDRHYMSANPAGQSQSVFARLATKTEIKQ